MSIRNLLSANNYQLANAPSTFSYPLIQAATSGASTTQVLTIAIPLNSVLVFNVTAVAGSKTTPKYGYIQTSRAFANVGGTLDTNAAASTPVTSETGTTSLAITFGTSGTNVTVTVGNSGTITTCDWNVYVTTLICDISNSS